jgi:hypothetical protein
MREEVGFSMFGAMDEIISSELNVSTELYNDVIENRCSYWEGMFIVFSIISERPDKIEKSVKLFNSKIK